MKKIFAFSVVVIVALWAVTWMGCSKDDKDDDDNVTQPSVLFEGAFDSIITYPAPAELIYVSQDGGLVKADVFPGQVIVLATTETTADQMKELVVKNSGKIVVQVPFIGHYVIQTDPAKTNAFLNAMYSSPLVSLACPNRPSTAKNAVGESGIRKSTLQENAIRESTIGESAIRLKSSMGDAGSIIQTVDVESMIGCNQLSHLDAVALVAAQSGVGVNTNDVSVDIYGRGDYSRPFVKTVQLIEYAYQHKTPMVINLSLGGKDEKAGDPMLFYTLMCSTLETVARKKAEMLEYVVVNLALTNNHWDESPEINVLKAKDPESEIWKHLYFVGAEEGAGGCTDGGGVGYAVSGTENYLSAPACNQPIPTTNCALTGTSGAVPQVSGVVARTYELLKQDNQELPLWQISDALWQYQKSYSGNLPTPEQLVAFITGDIQEALYDGNWKGTFQYRASVPQEEGPNVIVNASFMVTFTLKSEVAVTGYPHLLRFQVVTCSDPRFGATMPVVPDQQLSMAFLPGSYGSQSDQGLGIIIEFPNGSTIMTNNDEAGTFTVDPTGRIIESTALVEDDAFLASTGIGDSNDPNSGPGLYAYNWCMFKHWKVERVD